MSQALVLYVKNLEIKRLIQKNSEIKLNKND